MYSDINNLESMRFENLILEREAYENDFISIECIQKSEEMNFQIIQNNFELDYSNPDDANLNYPFEHLDLLDFERDKNLIEEYEVCEIDFTDEFVLPEDYFDIIIEMHENPEKDNFIEYYDDYGYDDCLVDIDGYIEADIIRGYVPSNDPFDSLDGGYEYLDEPYGYYV